MQWTNVLHYLSKNVVFNPNSWTAYDQLTKYSYSEHLVSLLVLLNSSGH